MASHQLPVLLFYQQASPFGDKRPLVRGGPLIPPAERRMRLNNRTIEIKVRLNQKEADVLNERVKKSRLSREAYLRHLINGLMSQDAPPPDYYAMMRELYRIGNNLNQIARKAKTLNMIDVPLYKKVVGEFETTVKKITEAVVMPRQLGG